jgi:hypothetical protein
VQIELRENAGFKDKNWGLMFFALLIFLD